MTNSENVRTTWSDVHEQNNTLLITIKEVSGLIRALNAAKLSGDAGKVLLGCANKVSEICRDQAAIGIRSKPTAETEVTSELFMDYYNTFSEVSRLCAEIGEVVGAVETINGDV